MRPSERARLEYAPHLRYIKDLIFSEGVAEEDLPPALDALMVSPPSLLLVQAGSVIEDFSQMLEDLERQLRDHPGFEAYRARLNAESLQTSVSDDELIRRLQQEKTSQVLLHRSLYRVRQEAEAWAEIVRESAAHLDNEQAEREYFEQWALDELAERRLTEQVRLLEPLVPDQNPDPEAFRRLASLKDQLDRARIANRRRRQDVSASVLPIARRSLSLMDRVRARYLELVYGTLYNDLRGDPRPLLVTLLDIAFSGSTLGGVRQFRETLRTVRRVVFLLRNLRRFTAQQTVGWIALLFASPARRHFNQVFREANRFRREIFYPLSDILKLLAEADDGSPATADFAHTLLDGMELLNRFSREASRELARFERRMEADIETSLGEVSELKRLDATLAVIDATLAEIDRFPLDLSQPSARRRFVNEIVRSRNWDRRYDPQTRSVVPVISEDNPVREA